MTGALFRFYWREIPGPKLVVLIMPLVSASAQGLLLATLNAAIEGRRHDGWSALGFALFLAMYLVASYFTMYKATEMTGRMAHRLRVRISKKLAGSALSVVEHYGRGEIYTHITRDIDRLAGNALNLPGTVHAAVLLLFCITYVGSLSMVGMVVMVMAILLGVATYLLQEKQANVNLRTARTEEAAFFDVIDDELGGFKEIKLHEGRRISLLTHIEAISDRFRFHQARSKLLFFVSFLGSQLFLFGAIAIVVLLPEEWLIGDFTVHFKLLTAFLFSIEPIKGVVEFIEPCNNSIVSLNKLHQLEALLDQSAEMTATEAPVSPVAPHIAMRSACMRHFDSIHDVVFDVGPLDLDFAPGTVTFVVGGNGSGKTSLLKLLTGLYLPSAGHILLDGTVVEPAQAADFRQRFAAVFSDFHLFRRLYGLEQSEPDAVDAMVSRFGLAGKTAFSDGRFTNQDLSAGQRKRLALIALLLERRPVLVFDEFAADQDPSFRAYFYQTILPELRALGKTVIVATHDDAYFRCCDQLIKMDKGQVISAQRNPFGDRDDAGKDVGGKKNMRKNVSSIGGLALLLAWSVFALPGYSLAADSGDSRIGALGILRPKGGVAVLAGPGGSTVAAVFVAQNDMVHKGQPLLRFSNGETAEAELTTIRLDQEELVGNNRNDLRLKDLDIAKAQTDLERTERSLANYQAIGQSAQVATIREDRENQVRDARHALKVRQAERDGMQARFQGALAKLENRRRIAQITLENTQLTAPFDGVVLDVRKQPGESSAGELLTLADISVMQVDADVFEGDLGKLRVGQTATVTSKSLLTQQTATVESVGRQINVDRKVAKVLLRMEKSDPAARYVGMEVNVSIQP